jgi:hypothetical protein
MALRLIENCRPGATFPLERMLFFKLNFWPRGRSFFAGNEMAVDSSLKFKEA